ncbi:phosphotransferase [Acrocarpospora catenulata]|uniref:phosphotransferase n=1 Tax=Acrocarpospora catenulata TaxID=2836182 RepID=UPI001BD9DFA2|nr:phosphotransferase [Acrocarpospora catenulata]
MHTAETPASSTIPRSMADFTPDWLTTVLAPSFPGVVVSSATVETVNTGVAMTARIHLTYENDSPDYPRSVCVKCCFGSPHSPVMLDGGLYAKEAYMYGRMLPDLPLNVPRCFSSGYDDATKSAYIMLEDLTLRNGTFSSADRSLTVEQVDDVLSQQAAMHAMTWDAPWLHDRRWLHHGVPLGERDPFYDLFTERIPEFLEMPRGGALPRRFRDPVFLREALYRLLELDGRATPCLIHGDAHTGNLFIDGEGRPGLLDWQCARAGHWSLDVAKTMMSALDPEDRRSSEKALLRRYLRTLSEHGAPAPDWDEAWDSYRRHAVFGLWIWLVTPPDMQTELRVTATVYKFGVAAIDLNAMEAMA